MGKKFKKAFVWLLVHVTGFVLVVWFFMGITPRDTYYKTTTQLSKYVNSVKSSFGLFTDASSRLGAKANKYGLQEAKDVMDGKDYYEGYNMNLDQKVRSNMGL